LLQKDVTQADVLAELSLQEAEILKQRPAWIKTNLSETKMVSMGIELEGLQYVFILYLDPQFDPQCLPGVS
jgi:hypothetical protein